MKKLLKNVDKAEEARPKLPEFKSEPAEAAWWDQNIDKFHSDILARGQHRPALKVRRTKAVTIRLAEEDLDLAKSLASESDVSYQKFVRDLLQKAIRQYKPRVMHSGSAPVL